MRDLIGYIALVMVVGGLVLTIIQRIHEWFSDRLESWKLDGQSRETASEASTADREPRLHGRTPTAGPTMSGCPTSKIGQRRASRSRLEPAIR
jgi:hypothetical protein